MNKLSHQAQPTMVHLGTILGQDIYVKLRGQSEDERENYYRMTQDMMAVAFQVKEMGEVSDGYHTFNELYAYRMAYNALLFNEWFKAGKNDVHWSRKHSTGEDCFGGGWFVVVAQTPSGQITNHYELKDLQWFAAIEERERAAEWDGHTPAEAFDRLRKEAWNFSIPF